MRLIAPSGRLWTLCSHHIKQCLHKWSTPSLSLLLVVMMSIILPATPCSSLPDFAIGVPQPCTPLVGMVSSGDDSGWVMIVVMMMR